MAESFRTMLMPEQLQDAQKGCPARPQRGKRRGVRFGTLSPLSDARTPLADFFSILLGRRLVWILLAQTRKQTETVI